MSGYSEEYKKLVAEERARRKNQPIPEPVEILHSESPSLPDPVMEVPPAPPVRIFRDAGGSG